MQPRGGGGGRDRAPNINAVADLEGRPGTDSRVQADDAYWRRNLRAVWISQFTSKIGSSFATPFIAVYLNSELAVHGSRLSLWAGLAAGASGVGTAVAGPLWGALADRRGRKPMLIRALFGGALSLGLMSIAQAAWHLVALRFLQGATGGTSSAATALIAAGTPRRHVARALGTLSSAATLAGAIAPLLGGVSAATVGLRYGFLASGALVLLSLLPVLLVVREGHSTRSNQAISHGGLRPDPPARTAAGAVAVVLTGQLLMNFGYFAAQQLVVVRLLDLLPPRAASTATGVGFAAAGITATIAAVFYPRLTTRLGYRTLASAAAVGLGAAIVVCAIAPSATGIMIGLLAIGLTYGGLAPLLSAMLGLATPRQKQATIYGYSASALAIGFAAGPALSGTLASLTTPSTALYLGGILLLIFGLLVATTKSAQERAHIH
jgi:MFS transporter, DHA1 family, multidrug resistance protein